MKKLLTTTIFSIGVFLASEAQIAKGAIMLGGSSTLSFTSTSGPSNYTQFSLFGEAGYFFVDNLGAGISLQYSRIENVSVTGIGVFGRYYVQGKVILGGSIGTTVSNGYSTDFSNTSLGAEAGYAAFITKNIAIEPTLNFTQLTGDSDSSNFGLRVGLMLYLNRD